MSAPTPPEPGQTKIISGETVTVIERPDRMPLYEVRGQHGVRMVHWCWEAICHCCWGWVARSISGQVEAATWHSRRFGRNRPTLHVDGVDLEIKHWAVITGWHVSLYFEGGRRIVVDEGDRIVSDSDWPAEVAGQIRRLCREPAPQFEPEPQPEPAPQPEPDLATTRAMLAGRAPSPQLSLFGGST